MLVCCWEEEGKGGKGERGVCRAYRGGGRGEGTRGCVLLRHDTEETMVMEGGGGVIQDGGLVMSKKEEEDTYLYI